MDPNPQDAHPLGRRPNIERFKKRAKDLLKKFKAGTLKTEDPFSTFAARKLAKKPNLATAQFVIAKAHGFASWPKFTKHIDDLPVSTFEKAADAIVSGDANTVERLLRKEPRLVRARSAREHRATLLHYVSANGVEGFRQKTPPNIVAITRLLLDAGADVDAECSAYGLHDTTLMLVATSVHPEVAGVQNELLDFLLQRGARMRAGDVRACFANGRGAAGRFLAERGAPLTFEEAAGVGRLDEIRKMKPTNEEAARGFFWACQFGRNDVVEHLLGRGVPIDAQDNSGQTALHHAAIGGQMSTIKLLLQRKAPLEIRNQYDGRFSANAYGPPRTAAIRMSTCRSSRP